ncbi:MAG: hypothetical protein WBA04_11915, partial [Mycolicibacter algericus]
MTGPGIAALALAAAALLGGSPRGRLRPVDRRGQRGTRWAVLGLPAGCAALLAVVALPASGCLAGALAVGTAALRHHRR